MTPSFCLALSDMPENTLNINIHMTENMNTFVTAQLHCNSRLGVSYIENTQDLHTILLQADICVGKISVYKFLHEKMLET